MNKVIYHDNCIDGFAAAYTAWKRFGTDAQYIPMKFGVFLENAVREGDSVYIFDINFPPHFLLNWYDKAEHISLYDHHETHANEMLRLPFDVGIDLNECGATLAHKLFFPVEDVPPLLEYVRDRDLWKWELKDSKPINTYIASTPFSFMAWEILEHSMKDEMEEIVIAGQSMLNYQETLISQAVKSSYINRFLGYDVPMVNSSILQSEIGNALLEDYPEASFAVVYNVLSNGMKKYSLRSEPGRLDVGCLAKEYGGGGHTYSSGIMT